MQPSKRALGSRSASHLFTWVALLAACGGGAGGGGAGGGGANDDETPIDNPKQGSGGRTSGAGGMGGNGDGGTGDESGGAANPTGGAGSGCEEECTGAAPLCVEGDCVECLPDARSCDQDTPTECVDGQWSALEPCSGDTPACSGGVCAIARVTGRLSTVRGHLAAGDIRLVEHGFDSLLRTCGEVSGATVCVTGGLRP